MSDSTTNFRLSSGSLKDKTRLAMWALAFFAALCGLAGFALTYLFGASFYVVFLPFLFLAVTIVFYGRWLANEVVQPIEKVSLLAKSYERGVSTSVPKTSGSRETDELAHTIARLGGQVEKLVASMDEAANGNLNVVLSSAATSDRISRSFQRLLGKVSESIHAQQNLENLQAAIAELSSQAAALKNGNLSGKIISESAETGEISAALNFLSEELKEIAANLETQGAEAQGDSTAIRKTLLEVALAAESRMPEMNRAASSLKQIPETVRKIVEELSQSPAGKDAASSPDATTRNAEQAVKENFDAIGNLRRKIQDTVKRVQRVQENSHDFGKIAKTIEDLAQRSNLVALNASVQGNETGSHNAERNFAVISEEISRLADRAGNASRQIFTLNKSVQAEIGETENALLSAVSEAAALSKLALEISGSIAAMEKRVSAVASLQNRIGEYSNERISEAEAALQILQTGAAETESSLALLRESADRARKVSRVLEGLQSITADLKIPAPAAAAVIITEESESPDASDFSSPEMEMEEVNFSV